MASSIFLGSVLSDRDRAAAVHLIHRQAHRPLTNERRIEIIHACQNHAGIIVRLQHSNSPIAVVLLTRESDRTCDASPKNDFIITDAVVEPRYARVGVGRFAIEAAITMAVVVCDGTIGRIAVGSVAKGDECASFLQHMGITLIGSNVLRAGVDPWLSDLDHRLQRQKTRDMLLSFDHHVGLLDIKRIPEMAERIVAAAAGGLTHLTNGHNFRFIDPSGGRAAIVERLVALARRDMAALSRLGVRDEWPRPVATSKPETNSAL
jgi:hypothetical protein